MPRLLKDLMIGEVSSVDRGAGHGVKVMLMKRETVKKKPLAFNIGAEDDNSDNVIDFRQLKKDFRKDGAVDFDTTLEVQESSEAANGLMTELNEAICALSCSVNSIMWDDEVTDKSASVAESFQQFKSYLEGLKPSDMEKAMTPEQITKQITDAVAASMKDTTDKIQKLEDENTFLKMSPAEQEFCKAMTPEQKKAFAAKSKADKDKDMDDAKKALEVKIDPELKKRLDQADANEVLLKGLLSERDTAAFVKRATDAGLPAEMGETLRKAYGGDKEASAAIEKKFTELTAALKAAQKTGQIFSEFGSHQGGSAGGKAYDALMAKASELRKTEKDL